MEILSGIINDAMDVPQLKRGRVWCTVCGSTLKVNSGYALRYGWPKCHGLTMTIDSPEERERLNRPDSINSTHRP